MLEDTAISAELASFSHSPNVKRENYPGRHKLADRLTELSCVRVSSRPSASLNLMKQLSRKEELESAYNEEKDTDTKSRILLALKVKHDGVIRAHAARELHRSRAWATIWLQRFEDRGLEGLRTRERSGRPPKLDHRKFVSVKRKVMKNKCGWT